MKMSINYPLHYLKELAIARSQLAQLQSNLDNEQEALEQTDAYLAVQETEEAIKMMRGDVSRLEKGIKLEVEIEFVRTGLENKKPYDGIQIKKFQVVHILDEKEAIAWAGVNAPQVLSLRKAPFNKIAKVLDLSFVEIDTEYRAQIASDLSIYEDTDESDTTTTAEE